MTVSRRTFLAGGLALPAIASSRPAQAARFTLKFASELVDTHPGVVRIREAAEAINRETNGDVTIRIFPNSQLGSAQGMLVQIRSGAIDLYTAAAAGLSGVVPVVSISSMGFAFKDYSDVWAAVDGKLGAFIRDEIAKTGSIIALDKMWDNGFRQVTTSLKPINKPEDLQGMKIRVPIAPLYTSMFSALGAAPAALSITELYTSLQSKLVDGEENPLPIIDLYKYYEVQKYCSITNHMWDGFWLIANQRSWSRMPTDVRDVVAKHLNGAALAMRTDVAALNGGAVDRLTQQGMTINKVADLAPFQKALKDAGFYENWRKTYGETAWLALEATSGPL